jgi:hypothetical protein
LGIIERIPYKKNQYILCRKYYIAMSKNGEYIRINGLPRDKYKTLPFRHIENYSKDRLKDFANVLPDLLKKH